MSAQGPLSGHLKSQSSQARPLSFTTSRSYTRIAKRLGKRSGGGEPRPGTWLDLAF